MDVAYHRARFLEREVEDVGVDDLDVAMRRGRGRDAVPPWGAADERHAPATPTMGGD
jgi:hypothetical protein